jgi:hypothetical protein
LRAEMTVSGLAGVHWNSPGVILVDKYDTFLREILEGVPFEGARSGLVPSPGVAGVVVLVGH